MTDLQAGFVVGLAIATTLAVPLQLISRAKVKKLRRSNAILACNEDYHKTYIGMLEANLSPNVLNRIKTGQAMKLLNQDYRRNIRAIRTRGRY